MSEEKRGGGGKRAAGVGIAAAIILLIFGPGRGLGLGAGSGMGTGTAEGNDKNSQAVAAESTAPESAETVSTAESAVTESTAGTASELVIRVHNMEIYVDETLCETDEAVLKAVEEKLKDGMVLILQDDYADNEAFTTAEKILDEGAYEYRTETKK
ncbi:MAG: hypothetical protein VZR35_05790 [Lachnospiraceae bacterium]|nr:hypothetical protein [Lachnospiraceae bacterium]